MGLIYDKVTASNIAGYFNALQENVNSTLVSLFSQHASNLELNCLTSKGRLVKRLF